MNDQSNESAVAADESISHAEAWISTTLRAGVLLSLALIVLGMSITFTHHPQYAASQQELARLTQPGAAFPRTLPELAKGLAAFKGQAIVVAGLLVLIATPVLRVAISVLVFLEQRDYLFAVFTATVLAILLISFLLGKTGGG